MYGVWGVCGSNETQGVNQGEHNWCMFGMRCRVCVQYFVMFCGVSLVIV